MPQPPSGAEQAAQPSAACAKPAVDAEMTELVGADDDLFRVPVPRLWTSCGC